jgi:hypothetical protein
MLIMLFVALSLALTFKLNQILKFLWIQIKFKPISVFEILFKNGGNPIHVIDMKVAPNGKIYLLQIKLYFSETTNYFSWVNPLSVLLEKDYL